MLNRAHRLRRRGDFTNVVRTGRRAGRGTLVVHLRHTGEAAPPRAGFVVSRAVGGAVRLGPLLEDLGATRARVGYVDLCWSADKSVSLAWAMAPTEAERNLIAQAHKDAVASALRSVEAELGQARRGKAGRGGHDPGRIAWISFDHYASRPTVEVARTDGETGQAYTELVTLRAAGDPLEAVHD